MGKAMNLGGRIRELRKARGMSARALAERVGVHPQHVFAIERGRFTPTIPTLEKIAGALGVPVGDLFAEPAREGEAQENAFWRNYLAYAREALGQSESPDDHDRGASMEEVVRRLSVLGLDPEDIWALGLLLAHMLRKHAGRVEKPSAHT